MIDGFGIEHQHQRGLCVEREFSEDREVERRAYVRVRFVPLYDAAKILANDLCRKPIALWAEYQNGIKAEVW